MATEHLKELNGGAIECPGCGADTPARVVEVQRVKDCKVLDFTFICRTCWNAVKPVVLEALHGLRTQGQREPDEVPERGTAGRANGGEGEV